MKVTSWRKFPQLWKEIIILSIKSQETETDSHKILSLLAKEKDAKIVYKQLFNEDLTLNDWPDFTFFNRLIVLQKIYAANLPLEEIDPIMYFPLIKEIHLENTKVAELDALMLTASLENVYLNDSEVDDLSPIFEAPLKILNIKGLSIEQSQVDTVLLRHPNCEIITE
ncbi:hypothetical protein [Flammeovirga kamogawensis]|uniref:Leucine-rich repeat domain-containing protein n=1 Tax=Flammeovirga kamogawensis TaxID=373891 RepID=A0ABX8GV39_9BACT|nr:hypothetical protein [Flammeovirga kamogawensis]MBB6461617.1 hypothetical protein [Flammeovirga kamogawensis]QWG07455.1 hypothetical protein KM029_00490 [Flammeovirga kamogawensis]TRX69267.1 hypothetical protein EO216_14435 [Flammeovirga kamogawensis]